MWADFHNLDHAFQRAHLRAAFLQLPRGAVEHLAGARELRTVSENVVFLAIAGWLRARMRGAAAEGAGAEAAAAEDALALLRLVGGPAAALARTRVRACGRVLPRVRFFECAWGGGGKVAARHTAWPRDSLQPEPLSRTL